MEKEIAAGNPHVLVLPFPAQGHVNPALAFAKHLATKKLQVTFITTTSFSNAAKLPRFSSVAIATVSDGSEHVDHPETTEAYFKRFRASVSQNLAEFIDGQERPAKAIIYDSTMPWVLEVAHAQGLLGASFFTQSCAADAVFCHVKQGLLRFPYEYGCDGEVSLPCLPKLRASDLPALDQFMDANQTVANLLADQFSNVDQVDWMFINTFVELEKEMLEWMARQWSIKTVGPTFLLAQTDKSEMISLFEPKQDTCREWLDSRQLGSVVYVSFGSIASLGKEQMEELAFGLITSNCHFLWVVRSSEVEKLPQDVISMAGEKGLIVDWCHQQQVLAHGALSCFLTHCGWNSVLEALSLGIPLVAMAQWADQTTNAKFVEDVWRVGVRVKPGENGIVGREEIANGIDKVVDGEGGIEMRRNASKWKELANEAVRKGGTSANNIQDFVTQLNSLP